MKNRKFAKLFETDVGQILVLIESADDDDKECINIYFKIDGNSARVSIGAFSSEENADKAFAIIDYDDVYKSVKNFLDRFNSLNE